MQKPHDIVVIESGVKHDITCCWNLFLFFSGQVQNNDTDTTAVHFETIRLAYIQVQT